MDLIFVIILGALWGSFANVCIIRMPQGKGVVVGRSFCVKCNKKAIINSKFIINEKGIRSIVYEGEQIDLGGEEKYEPLCWKCWEK